MTDPLAVLDRHVGRIPPLSDRVLEILALLDAGVVDFRALEAGLADDPALATRVLQVANSPFYGFPRAVRTFREACMVLGLTGIRNIVLSVAVFHRCLADAPEPAPIRRIWSHNQRVAGAARLLAVRCDARVDEAFTAGLFHDLGSLVLAAYLREEFHAVAACRAEQGIPEVEAERAVLGFDHGVLGARVGALWRLPESLAAVIDAHHRESPDRPGPPLTDLVRVADAASGTDGIATGDPEPAPGDIDACLTRLGLARCDLDAVVAELNGPVPRLPADDDAA